MSGASPEARSGARTRAPMALSTAWRSGAPWGGRRGDRALCASDHRPEPHFFRAVERVRGAACLRPAGDDAEGWSMAL